MIIIIIIIIMYTNAIHAHMWGHPWIDDLGVFILTREQNELLLDATNKLDINILKNDTEFMQLWKEIDQFIQINGPVFFRLSPASPKDVRLHDDPDPPLKAKDAEKIFNVMTRSFRILEYLEDSGTNYAIILKKWNDNIKADSEYRCFIFNRKCEAVAKMIDGSEPSDEIKHILGKYIEENVNRFPEDDVAIDVSVSDNNVIFIEFNPVDEELDTYGIVHRGIQLSEYAHEALQRMPRL